MANVTPPSGFKSWDEYYAANPGAVPSAGAVAPTPSPKTSVATAAAAPESSAWGSTADWGKAGGAALSTLGAGLASMGGGRVDAPSAQKQDEKKSDVPAAAAAQGPEERAGGLTRAQWAEAAGREISDDEWARIRAHYRPITVSKGDGANASYATKVEGKGVQEGVEWLNTNNPVYGQPAPVPAANPYGSKANEQLYNDMMAPKPAEPVSKMKYWGFEDSASAANPQGAQPTGPVGMKATGTNIVAAPSYSGFDGPQGPKINAGKPYSTSVTDPGLDLKKPLTPHWVQPAQAPAPAPAAAPQQVVVAPPPVAAAPAVKKPVAIVASPGGYTPAPAASGGYTSAGYTPAQAQPKPKPSGPMATPVSSQTPAQNYTPAPVLSFVNEYPASGAKKAVIAPAPAAPAPTASGGFSPEYGLVSVPKQQPVMSSESTMSQEDLDYYVKHYKAPPPAAAPAPAPAPVVVVAAAPKPAPGAQISYEPSTPEEWEAQIKSKKKSK